MVSPVEAMSFPGLWVLQSTRGIFVVAAPGVVTEWLAVVSLLALRVAATFMMTPVLYAAPLPVSVRMLLLVGLSVALASGLPTPSQVWTGWGDYLIAAVSELALGATLGVGILLAFGAFSVAGQLLDVQLGFAMAQIVDPVTRRPTPI